MGFFASYQLIITLHDSPGNEVVRQNLIDSVKVQTFKDVDRPRVPRLIRFGFLVEPGEYEARMKLTDLEAHLHSRRTSVQDKQIKVC